MLLLIKKCMVLIRKLSEEIEIGSVMGARIKARKMVSFTHDAPHNKIVAFAM